MTAETNNNVKSAKTNGETMNKGKKETMNEAKKETMSEGPPVDSFASTAATATEQQSDASSLVAHYLAICDVISCDTSYLVSPYPLNLGRALIVQENKGFSCPMTPHFMSSAWTSVLLLICFF